MLHPRSKGVQLIEKERKREKKREITIRALIEKVESQEAISGGRRRRRRLVNTLGLLDHTC